MEGNEGRQKERKKRNERGNLDGLVFGFMEVVVKQIMMAHYFYVPFPQQQQVVQLMDSMESHTNNCAGQKPNCVSPSSLLPPPPLTLPRFPSLIQIKEKKEERRRHQIPYHLLQENYILIHNKNFVSLNVNHSQS
jgi:hypothetical protein